MAVLARWPLALCALAAGCLLACEGTRDDAAQRPALQPDRPNILLIIADDLGFAELGAFGGEIATPHLDALAQAGVRFTRFHAAPVCSPSRAMLFSGADSHQVGLGNMAEELAPNQKGQPGYEGHLNERALSVAERLRDAGYHTYLTGKWHLGMSAEHSPTARGFERSFAMLAGGAHHFSDMQPAYSPDPDGIAPFREDGRMLDRLPEGYRYSSQFFVDRMMEYLEADRRDARPFFAVLSFMAPHWPIQAPADARERYRGRYDAGYEALAQRRLGRQQAMGLVGRRSVLAPLAPGVPPWAALDAPQRRSQARAMELYAAMVERMDHHSGRLLDYLRARKLLDHTLVVFLSDNGAEGHDLDQTWPREIFPAIREVIDTRHDFSYDNMGAPNSYVLYGGGWARAGAPAFRLYKGFVTEGGIRVPAFMRYPGVIPKGLIHDGRFHITDIAPTLLSVAGLGPRADASSGAGSRDASHAPISGQDMLPYIRSPSATPASPARVEVHEVLGKRYVMDYPWKIVHQPPPFGKGRWALYNLAQDVAELHDLASEHPERLRELVAHWRSYARANKVILPNELSGY